MNVDPTGASWCAGLFEGEGTVTICGGRRRLVVKMVEEESVRRFHTTMCCGSVYGPYGPYASNLGQKPHWLWLAELGEADRAVEILFPHLSGWRRERIHALFPDVVGEQEAA